MKLEPRGKYPGIKIHLDEVEVKALTNPPPSEMEAFAFTTRLGKKIRALMAEFPDLLAPRTEEQIKAELQLELEKSQLKLAKMAEGAKWNE